MVQSLTVGLVGKPSIALNDSHTQLEWDPILDFQNLNICSQGATQWLGCGDKLTKAEEMQSATAAATLLPLEVRMETPVMKLGLYRAIR